jgi:ubiquinone/menaquinone biosynthesis C-methylase UbiE
VLEIGCGAARWSIALANRGARAVGIDLSSAQLVHAKRNARKARSGVRLVRGNAERLPFAPGSFDIVFCDWGAMTFCDPLRAVPEAARVLRLGGRLVFATSSPFRNLAENRRGYRIGRKLLYDYFGLHKIEYEKEVNFNLPYGEWIRLFTENGFAVETLLETRPRSRDRSSYLPPTAEHWARQWPLESIWRVRKVGL